MEDMRKQIQELFAKQALGVLASFEQPYPRTSLIAFAATHDLKIIVFATPRSTRKFHNIKANPNVCLLIDNRSNHVSDFTDAIAVSAFGAAHEIEKTKNERIAFYLLKHPYLREFVNAPTSALFEIRVKRYDFVSRFQNVSILDVDHHE